MYQNSTRRTSTNITPNSHPQFFIRRSDIAFDERLAFVEHVLATLNESRFGPGGVYQCVSRSNDRPELEPALLYDFSDDEPNAQVPYYVTSTLGRAGYQAGEAAYRRAKQIGLLVNSPNAPNSTTALTPNQGRGSP